MVLVYVSTLIFSPCPRTEGIDSETLLHYSIVTITELRIRLRITKGWPELTAMADQGVFLKKSWGFDGEGKDFDEEDVWGVAKERDDSVPKTTRACKESCDSSSAWRLPAAPRKIPRTNVLPSNSSDAPLVQLQGSSSAPMDIPDWSKIYGKNCKKGSRDCVNNKCDDDEDDDMVPPHEWIARKLARSQISSFSVCEGNGRTLKGRDLSKVRNAILTKTGFIE
ncbi:hypothetical protein VNO77_01744 [Canavalia gladiata]|uniref:Senescence regulator S40 n=1 Tax=Canavalia gladiata TaxID=3824 RepID=A0AAN9R6K8_CANGL